MGEMHDAINKIVKSCQQTGNEIDEGAQTLADLKPKIRQTLERAEKERIKIETLTKKLETKAGKWDSEKARYDTQY